MKFTKLLPKLAFLLLVLLTIAAFIWGWNGNFAVRQTAAKYATYLTPSDFTFYIFGIILLGLTVLALFQLLPKQQRHKRLGNIQNQLFISVLFQLVWLLAWRYELIFMSAVANLAMIYGLISAYRGLEMRIAVQSNEHWLIRAPISLFFGWSTILTTFTVAALIYAHKLQLKWLSAELWATLVMISVGLLGLWIALRFSDLFFITAIAWGFIGIALKQRENILVSRIAWLSIFVMALVLLLKAPRKLIEE